MAFQRWLAEPVDDGTKGKGGAQNKCERRVKLETAARGGSAKARLILENGPECPPYLMWIWEQYLDLCRGRTPGFNGPSLTWSDLDAWMRRRRIPLSQHQIDLIFDLEHVKPEGVELDG